MEIHIQQVDLKGASVAVAADQTEYSKASCPICRRDEESILLAEVCAEGASSLESAFCRSCEHRYLRKLPGPDWFQRYYTASWDTGRQARKSPLGGSLEKIQAFLRRVPLAKASWYRFRRLLWGDDLRAMQVLTFLLGVAKGDGSFYLPRPGLAKVLEIGCGYGAILEVLRREGFQVVGTEASPLRARRSRENGLAVFECPGDDFKPVEHLGPFDLAYSIHVLEHIADPAAHLAKLSPLIREEGYLYLQVPYVMHEVNFIHQSHTPVHVHSYSPRSLSLLLMGHGFTPVRLLVDNNLHILARKTLSSGTGFGALGAFRETAEPAHFLKMFNDLSREEGKPLRMRWDHAYLWVTGAENGSVLYQRKLHYQIQPVPSPHSMQFTLRFDHGHEPSFPVRLIHQAGRPPMWVKMN